ncbi:MAG: hypothetical protein ACRDT6_16565 [Micromonosporaceae bacterium]
MGDIISAARAFGRFAASVIAAAGQTSHQTAVNNARIALAEAHRRSQERREVDAVYAAIARASRPPLTAGRTPAGSGVR